MTEKKELNHAEQNARGWLETIREHIACLDADRDRLEELRDERDSYEPTDGDTRLKDTTCETFAELWTFDFSEEAAELAELEAAIKIDGDELDEEAVRERIQESPLSIQVRSDWHDPGAERESPDEFMILLSTGGPALRIVGDLDDHGQPYRAKLEHQDWGTPWTEFHGMTSDDDEALLRWASCFYFGD